MALPLQFRDHQEDRAVPWVPTNKKRIKNRKEDFEKMFIKFTGFPFVPAGDGGQVVHIIIGGEKSSAGAKK